ncbi:MAG: response regulator transcription factor [Anaerolineae bacterium]|nr:response regulator transcription factor [Anaerolineae bacterium]
MHIPIAPLASAPSIKVTAVRPLRVLLVDDQPIFLEGLRNLLVAQGIQVVGTATDGIEAQEQVRRIHPDVVVMDLHMPRCGGLEATRRIQAEFPDAKILILTVSASESDLFDTLKAGAAGYLLKNMDAGDFVDLLFNLDRSAPPVAPELAARMRAEFEQPAPEALALDAELTPQQQQVLALVAQGLTYRQVGQQLFISEATIKYHMKQILDRLHLRSRQQAIVYARRSGLAP